MVKNNNWGFILLLIVLFSNNCVKKREFIRFDSLSFVDSIAFYENRRFTGIAVIMDKNDTIAKYYIDNGLLYKQIFTDTVDGSLCEESIKDGLCNGPSTVRFTNGEIAYLHYSKGSLNGTQKTFYPNGKLAQIVTLRTDSILYPYFEYDSLGNVLCKGYMRNKIRDSLWYYNSSIMRGKEYIFYHNGKYVEIYPKKGGNRTDTIWVEKIEDTFFHFVFKDNEIVKCQEISIE